MRYEQNGIVCVDAHLSVNPTRQYTASEIKQMGKKFRFTVENMSQLNRKPSPDVTVQGTEWFVVLKKTDEHLSVFLYIKRKQFDENLLWKVNCCFKLIPYCNNTSVL